MTELELHRSVAEFLDWILLPPAMWTTVPSGWTAMNRGAAGRLKACGLKAGLPDIMVFYNGFAIGIELKIDKGIVSATQRETFNKLQAAGVPVSICRSVDDVEATLRACKIPMRKFSHGPQKSLASPESRRPQESAQGTCGAASKTEKVTMVGPFTQEDINQARKACDELNISYNVSRET